MSGRRGRAHPAMAALCAVSLSGCGLIRGCAEPAPDEVRVESSPRSLAVPEPTLVDSLYVSPRSYDFSRNEKLLDRVQAGPHGYFRFINAAFSQAVCRRFSGAFRGVPPVNLHGDAHLEQYAVTDLGRGLTDFDDSSKGPALLDLIRFGVSLHLALRMYAPDSNCAPFFEHFLEGYRSALDDPDVEAPRPAWVEEIRARFEKDRGKYFAWIDEIMKPIPRAQKLELEEALENYVAAMVRKHPDLDSDFFDVQSVGALKMGIGSALDEKYLVRVQGPTDESSDDVVLEVKEVRSLAGIDCIQGSGEADPFRILLAQARLAYKPYAYLGYIDFRGRKFWIHSWVDNYRELRLENLTQDPEALRQVVYDVGVQLGRGHPKIAGEFEIQLRQALIRFLDANQAELPGAISELSDGVVAAWLRFKAELPADGRLPGARAP